ncbi:MAG: thioredoxin-like domain-containing protein [Chitinophagaceae bacterium]
MKRLFLLLPALVSFLFLSAQTGYNIPITLKPYKNAYVYLGYHYGKKKALADSALLDANSTGAFKGTKSLAGGIYFIVSPRKEILFEILVDKQQQFSIEGDTTSLPASIKFKNSNDNTLFQSYTVQINQAGREAAEANQLAKTSDAAQAAKLRDRVQELNQFILKYRDSIEKKYPSSFLTALFRAMREPLVPPAAKHPGGKYDTQYAFRYYKSHYWDGVSLTDDRLIRTPIFEARLDKYYKDLVAPDPDSINREVDYMLLMSRSNAEMFKYLMVYFVQKYINPEFMGQDAVFVHLFEKYVNTGQAEFFTEQYKKHMSDRAYSLMANLIGAPASDLQMVDTLGKPTPLYKVNAEFTVLCFWDPTCGHCKEVVPKVDSIFQASWKAQGVKVYGVMVEGGKDNWLKFIHDNNLKDWIHVYQTDEQKNAEIASGKPSYRQLYDVYQTPVLYLLDKDKRIIAKKLNHLQIDEVMKLKRKKPSN